MRRRQWIAVAVVALGSLGAAGSLALGATKPKPAPTPVQLYRTYCGVCHAFAPAASAGFGSSKKSGLGTDGGPSFNQLRIPYAYTIQAITEPTGGHERVRLKVTPKQLTKIATYLAAATKQNPLPAMPTDG